MLWWRLWIVVYNYVLMHFGNTANKFALQQVKKVIYCVSGKGTKKQKRGASVGGVSGLPIMQHFILQANNTWTNKQKRT